MPLVAFIFVSIPWLAGGLALLALQRVLASPNSKPTSVRKQLPAVFIFGLGGLLGYLTLGYTIWALDVFGLPTLTLSFNAVTAVIALFALGALYRLPKHVAFTIHGTADWALSALLMLIMAYAVYMQSQNPLSAWDGLNHWAANAAEFIKEKTNEEQPNYTRMYLLKHPKTVVLINAWTGWINFLFGGHSWSAPWLLCMISICMMGAGYVYALTENAKSAKLCAALLATLPLAESHVLIAGYAEIWLSAVVLAGLLLSALGVQYQNFCWVAIGVVIGMLAITIKNTGLGYALCVWGAVISAFLIRRPNLITILAPIILCLGFWLWTFGFNLDSAALKFQWDPEANLLIAAGRHMNVNLNPFNQIGVNELYSLVLNQSFSVGGMILIFSAINLFSPSDHRATSPQEAISDEMAHLVWPVTATQLLILGAALILAMITLSQLFLTEGYQYALPDTDTGNSRFSLPLALLAIPTGIAAIRFHK